MLKKLLKACNDNHWYIIAATMICCLLLWVYGCQSKVASMIDPTQQINRDELKAEADYLTAKIKSKAANLDRQDEIKMLLLEQATIFGQTGNFNPTGLLNTCISIGAIGFGLNRNQKLKTVLKENSTEST